MHGSLDIQAPHTVEALRFVKLPNAQHNVQKDRKAQIQIFVQDVSLSILETVTFLCDGRFDFILSSLDITCDNTSV
jgi:hypothetical protein